MRRRTTKAFTLLELLMVIAIGMVLMAMAIPPGINAWRSYQITAAASGVSAAIQSTRYAAIMHGYPYELTLDSTNNTYQVLTEIPPATSYSAVVQTGSTTMPTPAIPISGYGNIVLNRTATFVFLPGGTVSETSNPSVMWFTLTNPYGVTDKFTVSGVGNVSVAQTVSAQ